MNRKTFFRKAVAWLLILTIANPAAMSPAFARDTDIFLTTTAGAVTAEPNVMIVLDTSDSMNYAEDWHEYPGNYDSHVEYLWNDLTIIGNAATPQNAESNSLIASGIGPTVTSITRSGNVATVTYGSAHNFLANWILKVYNATDPLYNGVFTIASVPSSTTLTFVMSGTPAANAVATSGHVLYASSRNPNPFSVYGFWGGTTDAPEDRLAMWTAAKTYANATESVISADPGTRAVWRNYNDLSWLYWTTSTIGSPQLRSPSMNRFSGHVQIVGGTRGGVSFGNTNNDFRAYNKCNDSGNAPAADVASNTNATGVSSQIDAVDGVTPQGLTPSTIFAPSSAPQNSGRYTGQRWLRWERFLGLRYGLNGNGDTPYGTTFSTTNTQASALNIGNISGTQQPGNNVSLRTDHAVDPNTLAGLKRDSYPEMPPYNQNTSNIGRSGQPIRTRVDTGAVGTVQAGDSYAGWTDVAADLGGFQFASSITGAPWSSTFVANASSAVFGAGTTPAFGVLAEVMKVYGITGPTGAYSTTTTTGPHIVFNSWLGNRDGSSAFGSRTGTPAYYDTGYTQGNVTAGSSTITITGNNGVSSFGAGQVVNISGAGAAGAYLVAQIASVATGSITLCTAAGGACNIGSYPLPASTVSNTPIATNIDLVSGGVVTTTTVCTRSCTVSPATTLDSVDANGQSQR